MELGLMYDIIYIKADHAFIFRVVSQLAQFSFSSIVLALFSVIDMHKYSNIDLIFNFLIAVCCYTVEIYACFLLLSSNMTDIWLSRRATTSVP